MRKAAVGLIKFYQRTISPGSNPGLFSELSGCRFYPSCSEYALGAIEKRGLWRGLAKSLLRILKCGPWTRGGINLP
ncbi:MAG: membrane protein insertion efficiency factor YidD [Parcubacteria group bacterium]|nr:membrane protein insertion efficiency factor YidD [Parcubacteria group bacterium]